MVTSVTAASIKGLPRGSGFLSLRLEERSLDHRRGCPRRCSSRRAFRPMNGPLFAASVQSRLSSKGEYICASMTALREGMYSTSARMSPASIRAMSRASIPAGVMSCPCPLFISASHNASARSRSTQTSYPRSPVYPVRAICAPWRVVDLSLREFRRIPGDDVVHKVQGILPADEVLVERRDVEQARRVTDRVILHLRDEGVRRGREISGPSSPFPAVAQCRRPRMKW